MLYKKFDEVMQELNNREWKNYTLLIGCTGENKVVNNPQNTVQKFSKYNELEEQYTSINRNLKSTIPYALSSSLKTVYMIATKKFSYNSAKYDDILDGIYYAIEDRITSVIPTIMNREDLQFYILLSTFEEKNLVHKELVKKLEKLERKLNLAYPFVIIEV